MNQARHSAKLLTVLCPMFNEEANIGALLHFFVHALPKEKELWVIDGGSTDQSAAIVLDWTSRHPNIRLLHNQHQTVPYALNIGIQASKGDPIVRLDAHTKYAEDYFEAVLQTFEKTGADIVGGPMRVVGDTPVQQAIGSATSKWFGIGDSRFHNERSNGWADSVYLGAWKREIFAEIGAFDEQLTRNQDDEFHYRARKHDKHIYLNPAIRSYYSPRKTLGQLFRQYYQYGFYKPLVFKRVQGSIRHRHLAPAGLVLYLLSLPLAFVWSGWLLPGFGYLGLNLFFSLSANIHWSARALALAVYPTLHLSYGLGFLRGLWHWNFEKHGS